MSRRRTLFLSCLGVTIIILGGVDPSEVAELFRCDGDRLLSAVVVVVVAAVELSALLEVDKLETDGAWAWVLSGFFKL